MEFQNLAAPEVSVIMATFNEPGNIIRQSIESILHQTLTNLELIILDDSTNEETKNIIETFSVDPRVKIIQKAEHIGFVKSLNMGFKMARGNFIARMDGDDISLLNRLELQVNYLNKHPKISVVGGSMHIIDEKGQITSYRKYPTSCLKFKWLSVYRTPLAHPTVMLRKACIQEGFLYDESYKKSEDLEYWLRLRKNGYKLANMPDYLLKYRVCGDLSQKRVNDHWIYNYKARIKNFYFNDLFFNLLSVIVSFSYTIMPNFIMRSIYRKENSRFHGK
jgi:glycosyltransferase EpsE